MRNINGLLLSLARLVPDELYLKIVYRLETGKRLNLKAPSTFNEKLQWLKLHDIHPEYQNMVDKIDAKNYVADIIGKEYIIPTIATFNCVDDIDFEMLPNQFVLKCTHDSGGIVVCKDKSTLNIEEAKRKLSKGWKNNYYKYNLEYPYKNIKPRIIAEKYMEDETGELRDYKFFCFNGTPQLLFVATDRGKTNTETKFDFFDLDWNHLPFTNGHPNNEITIPKPQNFDLMIDIAAKLSQGIPHIRIDLYNISGKIYFGEMTFFHWSGMTPFNPQIWDYKLGELIILPNDMNC